MKNIYIKIVAILIILAVALTTATAVFAAKDYNSSKSNSTSVAIIDQKIGNILLKYGVGGEEINRVTDALVVGIDEDNLRETLIAIGIGEEGVSEIFIKLDELGAGFIKADYQDKPVSIDTAGSGTDPDSAVSAIGAEDATQSKDYNTTRSNKAIEIDGVVQGGFQEIYVSGEGDASQSSTVNSGLELVKSFADDAGGVSMSAVDSFFDVYYELEVFIGVIAKDANITKTEAKIVVDALMAVSPAFKIDENGLQGARSEELFGDYNFLLATYGATLTESVAKRALDSFVNVTAKSLKDGKRVALVGFGSFSLPESKPADGIESETEVVEIKDGDDMVVRKKPGRTTYSNITLERGYSAFQDISENIIKNIGFVEPEERKNLIKELQVSRKTFQTEIVSMSLKIREDAKGLRDSFRGNMKATIGHVDHGKTSRIVAIHSKGLRMVNRFYSVSARFDHILGKIESRVEKLENRGYEVDSFFDIFTSIEKAKNMSIENKARLVELEAKYESFLLGENIKGIAEEARAIAKELKRETENLHTKLREIVKLIKLAVEEITLASEGIKRTN